MWVPGRGMPNVAGIAGCLGEMRGVLRSGCQEGCSSGHQSPLSVAQW